MSQGTTQSSGAAASGPVTSAADSAAAEVKSPSSKCNHW